MIYLKIIIKLYVLPLFVLIRSFKSCAFLVLLVGFVYGIFVPFGSNPLFMVIFLSL